VWWTHVQLGRAVRIVLPACVVQIIRAHYSEPDGVYTGFREAADQDIPGTQDEELEWPV
jgi:hypothetical protein